MPSIAALLHTSNHALQLGRVLETLYPCDEILIVDHGSHDATLRIAREYGARVVECLTDAAPGQYLQFARSDWILCLEPRESLTEALAASLYEWKSTKTASSLQAFNLFLREEKAQGWVDLPAPETRLIPRTWTCWQGWLPAYDLLAETLQGPLLRFTDNRE